MQGRQLTDANINSIRWLRAEHPDWSRQRLSEHLAQQWQWCNEAGRLKDMAVRTLLLKLQARGLINLPAPLNANGNRQRRRLMTVNSPICTQRIANFDLRSNPQSRMRDSICAAQARWASVR